MDTDSDILRIQNKRGTELILDEVKESFDKKRHFDLEIYCDKDPDPIRCHSVILLTLSPAFRSIISEMEDSFSVILPYISRTEMNDFITELYNNLRTDAESHVFCVSEYLNSYLSKAYDSKSFQKILHKTKVASNHHHDPSNHLETVIKVENIKTEVTDEDYVAKQEWDPSDFVQDYGYVEDEDYYDDYQNDTNYNPKKNLLKLKINKGRKRKEKNGLGEKPPRRERKKIFKERVTKNWMDIKPLNVSMSSLSNTLETHGSNFTVYIPKRTEDSFKHLMFGKHTLANANHFVAIVTSKDYEKFYIKPIVTDYWENVSDEIGQLSEFYKYFKWCFNMSDKGLINALVDLKHHTKGVLKNDELVDKYAELYKENSEEENQNLREEKLKGIYPYSTLKANILRSPNRLFKLFRFL